MRRCLSCGTTYVADAHEILYRLLQAEGALIRAGLRFPAGGSRLVAARAIAG